ncbi:unnamed protein product [Soboliphyme baturini]|uniref:Uncharacterized protein n=1 Tax=Soboliphyme baturini TaxID=241478 RepID=A0A183IKT9_9BILA|nr:unnamed protein product [Soboliphyme baturini]
MQKSVSHNGKWISSAGAYDEAMEYGRYSRTMWAWACDDGHCLAPSADCGLAGLALTTRVVSLLASPELFGFHTTSLPLDAHYCVGVKLANYGSRVTCRQGNLPPSVVSDDEVTLDGFDHAFGKAGGGSASRIFTDSTDLRADGRAGTSVRLVKALAERCRMHDGPRKHGKIVYVVDALPVPFRCRPLSTIVCDVTPLKNFRVEAKYDTPIYGHTSTEWLPNRSITKAALITCPTERTASSEMLIPLEHLLQTSKLCV